MTTVSASAASACLRSVEDVDRVISHAKLEVSDLLPQSQAISFSGHLLDLSRLHLLEVDRDLADLLETGQSLVLRGDPEDSVVLCTESKTFDVKEAETSNSLIIVETLDFPEEAGGGGLRQERLVVGRSVLGVSHRYLELTECRPRLQKLREVLSSTNEAGDSLMVAGRHDHKDSGSKGRSEVELLDRVQCSKAELLKALQELEAVSIGERRWCLLDPDYRMKVLSLVANFIEENSWSLDGVNREETLQALGEVEPEEVVGQVFDQYLEQQQQEETSGRWRLMTEKVSRFFGEYLLLQTGSAFDLGEFRQVWQEAVPEGVQTDLAHLRGIALIDASGNPQTVRYFPERNLSENVQERLQTLFDLREKWTVEEIEPFVETLTTPKLNVNALLTKFARGSKVNGVKYFSSKHGK